MNKSLLPKFKEGNIVEVREDIKIPYLPAIVIYPPYSEEGVCE